MSKNYVLQLSLGIGEPGWMANVWAIDDEDAKSLSENIFQRSQMVRLSSGAVLWDGDRPVQSWSLASAVDIRRLPR